MFRTMKPIAVLSVLLTICLIMIIKNYQTIRETTLSLQQREREDGPEFLLVRDKNHAHDNPLVSKSNVDSNNDAFGTFESNCMNRARVVCVPGLRDWMSRLVARRAPANDPELVQFTRALMEPPARHAMRKLPWSAFGVRDTPQAKFVDKLLHSQRNGVFIEAGAQDGERSSNTVWLEIERNWTGILVEVDPWFYTQLQGKLRHTYNFNVGLSPTNHITELVLSESSGGLGKMVNGSKIKDKDAIRLPCLPLQTLLLATGFESIDYLSLDVEGMEYDVLTSTPLREVRIRTVSVEYSHTNSTGIRSHLSKNGYKFEKQIDVYDRKNALAVKDYIFSKLA